MPSAQEFLCRLPTVATEEHRTTITQAFDIASNFMLQRQKIETNPNLSAQGKRDAMAALIAKDHGPQFKRLAEVLVRNQSYAATTRAKFRPAASDPKDILGEMKRDQIRVWMRGLPLHERMQAALKDETIRAAVMDAGGYLSGLTDVQHTELVDYHIKTKFAAEIRRVDEIDEANVNVDSALQVARNAVCRSSGMQPAEFLRLVSAEGHAVT